MEIPSSPTKPFRLFKRIPQQDYDIDGRSSLYENTIFPVLESTGFARDELYLAWDFQVASREHTLRQVLHMRDDALERIDGGVPYTINEVEHFTLEENEDVAKRIYGTMTVPNYTEDIGPDVLLTRDEDGLPYYNGTRDIAFTIIVPRVLIDEQRSGPIIQYGHGLMGSQSEVRGGYLGEIAKSLWICSSCCRLDRHVLCRSDQHHLHDHQRRISIRNHPRTMSTRVH